MQMFLAFDDEFFADMRLPPPHGASPHASCVFVSIRIRAEMICSPRSISDTIFVPIGNFPSDLGARLRTPSCIDRSSRQFGKTSGDGSASIAASPRGISREGATQYGGYRPHQSPVRSFLLGNGACNGHARQESEFAGRVFAATRRSDARRPYCHSHR